MKAAAKKPKPTNSRALILYSTLGLIAIGILAAVAFASRVPQSTAQPLAKATVKVGDQAPTFAVSTTAGPFDLATNTTPVFLEVFATWCPHCQHEVPVIDALAKKYAGKVSFVGVSGSELAMDGNSPESQADVLLFTQKLGVTYPVAYDPDRTVAAKYLEDGFPTVVIMNKAHKIVYYGSGEIPQATLDKAIASSL
jgi:thiol-disulfide isomerase/thioredoxin